MSPLPESFDVAVIGGGPAGTCTAMRLRHFGARVILADRATSAEKRQHVGESLPSSARVVLATLGLQLPLDVVEERPREHRVFWGEARGALPSRSDSGEAEAALMVWRGRFDKTLRDECERREVQVLHDATALESRPDTDGIRLSLLDGGRARRVRASFLVDASGRAGFLARSRALRQRESAFRTLALTAHFRTEETLGDGPTVIESFRSGWAWSAPVAGGIRDVTVFSDGDGKAKGRTFRELLAETEELRRMVGTKPVEGGVRGIDATPYGAEPYALERALLVGDAASFLDPISGHGLHKAMDGALVAAAVIRTILERPSSASAARRFYDDREEDLLKLTRERVRRLYRQETRFSEDPFWVARSRSPGTDDDAAASASAPSSSRPRPPLRFDMRLGPGQGVVVADAPVLEDDFVVERDVLLAPSRRPVRFFREVCLPELFARVIAAPDVANAIRAAPMARERSYAAIEWLYHHGFVKVRTTGD